MFHVALSIFRLFDEGLPPIGKHYVSCTPAYVNMDTKRGGKEAFLRKDLIVFVLHNLDLSKLKDNPSRILIECRSHNLDWFNEDTIKSFCSDVLKDAIGCLFLNQNLCVVPELSIMGERSDLWILKNGEVSIGLVEVKHPGEIDVMNNTWVFGQVHGYLQVLKNFYGVQYPIALLSTYTHWRVVSLENTDGFFKADEKLEAITVSTLSLPANSELSAYWVCLFVIYDSMDRRRMKKKKKKK